MVETKTNMYGNVHRFDLWSLYLCCENISSLNETNVYGSLLIV